MAETFAVNYWGSDPAKGNDDCWTGEDYTTLAAAQAAFDGPVSDRFNRTTAYVELIGPGVSKTRENLGFRPSKPEDDTEWANEIAMQAGMEFGVDGYNDARGC